MDIVKLQDIKSTHRNALHPYTQIMRKEKDDLRKQFHSPLQRKEQNTQEYIYLKKLKTYI